jgi:hypothetical protein
MKAPSLCRGCGFFHVENVENGKQGSTSGEAIDTGLVELVENVEFFSKEF